MRHKKRCISCGPNMTPRLEVDPPRFRSRTAAKVVCGFFLAAIAALLPYVPSWAAGPPVSLVMVEAPGCHFCMRWHAEIGLGYANTAEGRFAPLKRVGRSDPGLEGLAPVVYTPTFILMRDGRELSRLSGYPGAAYFYPELRPLLSAAGFTSATENERISAP
jgi:hypothetical protein